MEKGASNKVIAIATCAAALASIGGYVWHASIRPPVLEIYVFDTPGAPSVLVRTPDDRRILIDGGSNGSVVRGLTEALPFYSRRIDAVVLTSADAAHAAGLVGVTERYAVGAALVPSLDPVSLGLASSTDPACQALFSALAAKGTPVKPVSAGQTIDLGGSVAMDALFPAPAESFAYSRASPPMMLVAIRYGRTSAILGGSASVKIQKSVASRLAPADVLIVSTSALASNLAREFLSAAAPRFLVYARPVGKNGGKAGAAGEKHEADPLAGFMEDHRFDIREGGTVRIVSDGSSVRAEKIGPI
ncbi:MAG: MBL fold metallo-hydrolase [Patescibacteria group bacterium]|nr:MBL fold metallo-hydrolase [Patescibacteria group bacterium]